MNRRIFTLGCGATLLLNACANSSAGRTANILFELYSSSSASSFDPAYAQRLPFASMAASIGTGPRSLLVLGKIEGQELHWFSADRVVLVTQNGRLVRTAGLPANLAHTTLAENDTFLSSIREGLAQFPTRRQVDLMPSKNFGVPILGKVRTVGPELISVLDTSYPTVHVIETCHAPLLNWEFENHYWIEETEKQPMVRKSVQHYAPGFPPVGYEILKAPTA